MRRLQRLLQERGFGIERGRLARGTWVIVTAGVLALATAAGCSGSGGSSSGAGLPTGETTPSGGNGVPMRTRVGRTERELDLIAQPGYAPAAVTAPFTAATGCDVSVTTSRVPDEMVALIKSGRYDGISASGDVSNRLIAGHDVAPIDTSLVPALGDLSPKLQSPAATTAHGVHYGVAYLWSASPLVYSTTAVSPPPESWETVFDGFSYAGRVTVPDSPMYIADAALYLESTDKSLGITDPYELTAPQFDAVVQLLHRQRNQVGRYWRNRVGAVRDFRGETAVIGQVTVGTAAGLEAGGARVASVIPDEGMTGWVDSWMIAAAAPHPDCMLKWLAYAATPIVQASVAGVTDTSPANPAACPILDRLQPEYCSGHHAVDPDYFDNVSLWKTPLPTCDNGRDDCVGYTGWAQAWAGVTGSLSG